MTPLWTSEEIAAATGGTASASFSADSVTFDSREVIGGELFVAMRGEQMDGHSFVASAFERGAAGALVSEAVDGPHVRVADGLTALQALGRAARARTDARIVGVTGSVGKTSVKEALRLALSECAPERTHASVKSYNNHTGVPLSLARMPAGSAYGVFEMGMNHAGELSALTRLVRPHVAIVTAIAPAHMEFFDSEEAIADAKGEIFEGLEPGGVAVLPLDSPHFARLRDKAAQHASRILTFGTAKGADVRLTSSADVGAVTALTVAIGEEEEVALTLRQPGAHWIQNALAVLAVAHALGADLAAAALGIGQMRGLAGRGAQHEIDWPGGRVRLIDESYNANPASMRAALAVLQGAQGEGRKLAILGAMKELGEEGAAMHAALAQPIAEAGAEPVLLVGEEMRPLAERTGAPLVADAEAAGDWLRAELRAGDTVLVKGSNSVRLGRLITSLTEGGR